MPKAKLTFDISDPDDIRAHKIAVNAQEILWCIDDLNEWLREQMKYVEHTKEEYSMLEKTKNMLVKIAEERGVLNLIFD